jgi:hypothetical protein
MFCFGLGEFSNWQIIPSLANTVGTRGVPLVFAVTGAFIGGLIGWLAGKAFGGKQ